jgi:hypothetical protein
MTKNIIQDHMVYIILCGPGTYLPERNLADLDRATTIRDIAQAQYEGVVQVLECNPVEHICNDVTEDIMNAVCELWAEDGEPVADWQIEIIEQTRGIEAANSFARAA